MAILTPYYSSQFLRFLRKFSIRFLHPQVLLLRLLGVEVVFLPPALCFLSSSVSKVLGFGCGSTTLCLRGMVVEIFIDFYSPELSLFSRLFSGFVFAFDFGFPLIFLRDSASPCLRGEYWGLVVAPLRCV